MKTSKFKQQGATLIESLVSLIILAIAVIGMLGVQLRTLAETNISANRSQAILLVEDLSERIKANPKRYQALANYADKTVNSVLTSTANCGTASCNPEQLAEYDLAQWSESVVTHLPGGQARTFRSESDSRQLGVLIGWLSKEKSSDTDYVSQFQIPDSNLTSQVRCWENHICHLMYIQP